MKDVNRYGTIAGRIAGTLEEEDFRLDVESLASDLEWMVDLLEDDSEDKPNFMKVEQKLSGLEWDVSDLESDVVEGKFDTAAVLVRKFLLDMENEVRRRNAERDRAIEVKKVLERRVKELVQKMRGI